jgi:hypothetical protein
MHMADLPDLAQCRAELKEMGLLPDDELATVIVGSTARGWAHSTSDLDVVVISQTLVVDERLASLDVPLSPGLVPVTTFQARDMAWEVKFWIDGQVDQLLEKVSWTAFGQDNKVGFRLMDQEEYLLARLPTCLVLSGQDWVDKRRADIAESAFKALQIALALGESDKYCASALGQLSAGDAEGGVLSAKSAFTCTVEALLNASGEYLAPAKWRARRFRAANPALLSFDEYWSIETMRTYDPAAPHEWVKYVVSRCKDLSMDIEF